MPARSEKQRRLMAMAMARHNPSAVSKKNKGVLKMSKKQLEEFSVLDGEQQKQIREIVK